MPVATGTRLGPYEVIAPLGAGITIANFDVSSDGQRFIMVKDELTAGRLNVVLNWFSDLARLAPVALIPISSIASLLLAT